MSLTPPNADTVAYSALAALAGTVPPPAPQRSGLLIPEFSPKSVSAMILRVLVVVPLLFVTQTSTRFIVTPVVILGNVRIAAS